MKRLAIDTMFDVTTIDGLVNAISWIHSSETGADMSQVKKALQKNPAFRAELKRHNIGWREFKDYGFVKNYIARAGYIFIGMGKWNGIHDYEICKIEGDAIHSAIN